MRKDRIRKRKAEGEEKAEKDKEHCTLARCLWLPAEVYIRPDIDKPQHSCRESGEGVKRGVVLWCDGISYQPDSYNV